MIAIFSKKIYIHLKEEDHFFSIMNEITDQSAVNQCVLIAIFTDEENTVKTQFFNMFVTTENLFLNLKESIFKGHFPSKYDWI